MKVIEWNEETFTANQGAGASGMGYRMEWNLTQAYGEREYIRHLGLVPGREAGQLLGIVRTMNEHRVRALDLQTGETVWLSPEVKPASAACSQVSQLGVGDIDGDGVPEAIICSYVGDVWCVNTQDGSLKWHRQLPWHINNPRLDIRRAQAGQGAHVALVVGNEFRTTAPDDRPRINWVEHPTLILLDGAGEIVLEVPDYSAHNGDGHNVWMADVDGDGLCEIFVSGAHELIAFRGDGERLFSLPCKGDGGREQTHPDSLLVADGQLVFLDGTDGVLVASANGDVLQHQTFPKEVASHLQEIYRVETSAGPRYIVQNIRSRDSKMLCLNDELEVEWAAWMPGDMIPLVEADWDGDGETELVTGSHGRGQFNQQGVEVASLQVMKKDGTPVYWHRWPGDTLAVPLAVADLDGDGRDELVVGLGCPGGSEGRFSLPEGSEMRLVIMGEEARS